MSPDDQQQLAINTNDRTLWSNPSDGHTNGDSNGIKTLELFSADYETVEMFRWPAGTEFSNIHFAGGVEYFVLQGSFSDADDTYTEGSWLRLPAGSKQSIRVITDCKVFRKTGHLLNPVSYE